MKRLRGCLVVAFIFGCGFLIGGFLGAAIGWVGLFHKVVKGGPRAVREIIVQRASDDLHLKPEQRIAVKKVVDETAAELANATEEVRPRVEEIMGRGEQRIREVLDENQRRKFDNFANSGRRRWKAFQEEHAPKPPPESTPAPKPASDALPTPPATPAPAPAPEAAPVPSADATPAPPQ